jgi:hypothetical protein
LCGWHAACLVGLALILQHEGTRHVAAARGQASRPGAQLQLMLCVAVHGVYASVGRPVLCVPCCMVSLGMLHACYHVLCWADQQGLLCIQ